MASRSSSQKTSRSGKVSRKLLSQIRLFATDVDGVLTDAGMYYSESGDEWKKFNTRDGMGIKLLQRAGIITAIVTQERTKLVARRGQIGFPPRLARPAFSARRASLESRSSCLSRATPPFRDEPA